MADDLIPDELLSALRRVQARRPGLIVTKHCPPGQIFIADRKALEMLWQQAPDLPDKLLAMSPADWDELDEDQQRVIRGIAKVVGLEDA